MNKREKEKITIKNMYDAVYSNKARSIGKMIRKDVFGKNLSIGQNCILSLNDIDVMAQKALITESSKVLDIGCGDGSVALYIAKKFSCNVTGIDFSSKGIETAKKTAEENGLDKNTSFMEFSVEETTPFKDLSFDVIYSLDTFIHVYSKNELIQECQRILKNTGVFLLSDWVNMGDNPLDVERSGELWGYIYLANPKKYVDIIKKNGFKIIEITNNNAKFADIIKKWEKVNLSYKDFLIANCGEDYFNNAIKRWALARDLTQKNLLGQTIFKCIKQQ